MCSNDIQFSSSFGSWRAPSFLLSPEDIIVEEDSLPMITEENEISDERIHVENITYETFPEVERVETEYQINDEKLCSLSTLEELNKIMNARKIRGVERRKLKEKRKLLRMSKWMKQLEETLDLLEAMDISE